MFSLSRALAAGAVLFASVNAGDNFVISQVRTLGLTRVDPLVTPGANGPHAHNIVGASTFGPDSTTPESIENAKCTSGMIGDDKSIYWSPQLYYNQGNGSYTPMIGATRIYYFLKPLNQTKPVVAFPRGLRMLAGGPSNSRPATYPPRGELSYDQLQAMDPRIAAIKWGCGASAVQGQGDGGSLPGQRPYIPNDAPQGCGSVTIGVFFPSCNDGRLDSPDHFSHMAYPVDGSNGYVCPNSHPIKFPTMFLENFYFPNENQKYRGPGTDNWVLSNGDTLGLSMHADFINGWVPGSLEAILNECNTPNAPGENLAACASIAKSLSVANADNCRSEGNIVDEAVGLLEPINALPGCNPIWPVDARTKPTCKSDQVPMVPPTSRVDIIGLKIALAVAGGTSKVAAAPAAANNSQSYSYSYDYSSTYTSTSAYATSSVVSTSSAAPATSTGASSSSAAAAAAAFTDPAAKSSGTGSSSSAATTTSSYYDPNGYYGSEYGTSTSASSSTSTSVSASSATSASYSDPYGYAAPSDVKPTAPASTSASTSSASSSSSSGSASVAAAPASTASAAGVPASGPATSSVNPVSSSTYVPHANAAPTHSKHLNPATSKVATSSASTSTPTPQKANAVGHGRPPKKTCAHRKHPKSHARRRRDWNKQIIN